jgi:hypothetical protein
MDDFADVVDWSLDSPDPPGGVRHVFLHGFRLRQLLAPRVRDGPRELGPGDFLVGSTWIGVREMALCDGVGLVAKLRGWVGFRGVRPRCLLSFWVQSLCDQHHAHDIGCRRNVEQ